jgi:hypothetical protein
MTPAGAIPYLEHRHAAGFGATAQGAVTFLLIEHLLSAGLLHFPPLAGFVTTVLHHGGS